MPIYEYKCTKCNRVFEVLQKINSEPLKKCIYCDGKVEKLISLSSFQFKGNGWYETDYKKNSSGNKEHFKSSNINGGKNDTGVSDKTENKKEKKSTGSKGKNENAA